MTTYEICPIAEREHGLESEEPQGYVLITPARNEEKYIARTIESVVHQTVQPVRYVIVSDGSTDQTDSIVRSYETIYPFIKLIRYEKNKFANFCSKVFAFNEGLKQIRDEGISYSFIGNLDADVSFEKEYFENLLKLFKADHKLGIAGGQIFEEHYGKKVRHRNSSYSVAGAVMFFRRECYETVGGYIPIDIGGEDTTAEITARARGWSVRTITELTVMHNKPCLSGSKTFLHSKFKQGLSNYMMGYHPLFQLAVCCNRIIDKPFIGASVAMGAGYIWGGMIRKKRILHEDVIRFLRREQLSKLFPFIRKPL